MCPCSPNDVSIPLPTGPTVPTIPGFGQPSALKLPDISPFLDGFPEDLLDLFNKFQMLIPSGILKPPLHLNYSKDIFDAIMKLMDAFFPILMVYKLFLPLLNMLLCILEVLCSIANPFKLTRAMRRLFRVCIPNFLSLFPVFALLIMIISLLLLLLALIEYIISQLLKLINALISNINALVHAFEEANDQSVLAIAKKIGSLLCIFQNLFVLLSLFSVVIGVIKDILGLAFAIPPCDNSDATDADNCCTPDVCPVIVQSNYTRTTGTFQYLNQVGLETTLPLSPTLGNFVFDLRPESWQLFDPNQEIAQKFINIIDGYDIPANISPKPVFFPTDSSYSSATPPKQSAYTCDLRLFYNPTSWGRTGDVRYIRFKDCIVIAPTSPTLTIYNTTTISEPTGVLSLAGGLGFEDDGTTVLTAFMPDGITPDLSRQATLETFIHKSSEISVTPVFLPTDGYSFVGDVEYTFKPNMPILLSKDLVTLGCEPSLALNRTFINTVFAGDAVIKSQELNNLLSGLAGPFPDTAGTQECLSTALAGLRNNLTIEGVANFQATATLCLSKLRDDTNSALGSLIGIGFDPCQSTFTVDPKVQFTTNPITVKVHLKERNGLDIATGISGDVAANLAARLSAHLNFGDISNFVYDGYGAFTAEITSTKPGTGQISISLDNNIFCTNTIPADNAIPPTHTLQSLDYQFIYTPVAGGIPQVGIGDTSDGAPRHDNTDLSGDSLSRKDNG